ncbi:uncharacterized protein [Diabrotica undecimpunctata]|uniref:uncharacterized protein n=1 Tax=Diabrotica undecimpunctata TaxID=50387 RepID=UPI003B633533
MYQRNKELFNGGTTSLKRLLKELEFEWMKDNPRREFMELPNVVCKRVQFLRTYKVAKDEGIYQFVFLDETWIFQNGIIGHFWQNKNIKSVKTTKTDGKRYIRLHAGNETGFIEDAEAIFCSKTQLSDYHGEMNQANFLKWFKYQLLQNLENPSLIVLNNAPYHSMLLHKTPNTGWSKSAIEEWLTEKNIPYFHMMFKIELLLIISQIKPQIKYIVDDMAERYGHKVLRLPPYHCLFNPIELIWSIAKNYYNRHIGRDGKSANNYLNMWHDTLYMITPDMWKNSINHTEREIFK